MRRAAPLGAADASGREGRTAVRRVVVGAGVAGLLALGAAACGAGDNGGTVQTPPTTTTTNPGTSSSSSTTSSSSTLPGGS